MKEKTDSNTSSIEIVDETGYDYSDDDSHEDGDEDRKSLLSRGKATSTTSHQRQSELIVSRQSSPSPLLMQQQLLYADARPYWLGLGLFLILFAFWLLDSMKDSIFAVLVNGEIEYHQPPAKLCSVATTLGLVVLLELASSARSNDKRKQQQKQRQQSTRANQDDPYNVSYRQRESEVLEGGGTWSRMTVETAQQLQQKDECTIGNGDEPVSASMFLHIGVSYCVIFLICAYLLDLHPVDAADFITNKREFTVWHILAYFFYAMVESFGSLAVATFWSYTNSTLSLHDAERYYGFIIAVAQLGAIAGSTMVTNNNRWSANTLLVVACLIMLLMAIVMTTYDKRFPPTSNVPSIPLPSSALTSPWSGILLILKHNYVLLILGASCLYEISLTCLDYQMKMLGYNRFETAAAQDGNTTMMTFAQFLGHFGQVTNILSLLFSALLFPWSIRRLGLNWTLRIFPTLLLCVTVLSYTALPGNLVMLFVSVSLLKAMTYSIHDPSKEMLYLPTSNAIKFKAKFWIDVVGERIAKAIGSSINKAAGSVQQSLVISSWPSILTAVGLYIVCYKVGADFEDLVATGGFVGSGCNRYQVLPVVEVIEEEHEDDYDADRINSVVEMAPRAKKHADDADNK